ncbi:hypothetical protein T03_9159 [Trichinella britovi]|uniref:Uncharacterized protein n=1 Tax=Trichinella britovi TaxID=45882 RepID=A0A0V0YV83_TRIBR|nr:hypothetical protein T03_9159 [Trichinella britovi]
MNSVKVLPRKTVSLSVSSSSGGPVRVARQQTATVRSR